MIVTPTHYWLGLIPCITIPEDNVCRGIEFDLETIELYGLDRLNELNQELRKYWEYSTVIPVDQLEYFLNQMEEIK